MVYISKLIDRIAFVVPNFAKELLQKIRGTIGNPKIWVL